VRSAICWTAEPAALTIVAESSGLVCLPVRAASIGSARAAAFARCDLGGEHPPGDRLAAPQLTEPRRGPDDHAEPAAANPGLITPRHRPSHCRCLWLSRDGAWCSKKTRPGPVALNPHPAQLRRHSRQLDDPLAARLGHGPGRDTSGFGPRRQHCRRLLFACSSCWQLPTSRLRPRPTTWRTRATGPGPAAVRHHQAGHRARGLPLRSR
jgi:hypothetical protein